MKRLSGLTAEQVAKLQYISAQDPEGEVARAWRQCLQHQQERRAELETQYRQHQSALKEQLTLSAELGDIQLRFHNAIESLRHRQYITRAEGQKLFRSVDAPLTSLILELQSLLLVDGEWFKAPYLAIEDQPQ
jgi:ABC-type transport system involved in cytochrome c biogenesis ATPase subunit